MRRPLSILLVASLLLALPTVVADDDEDERDGERRGRGPPARLGAFQLEESGRTATGQHLSFTYSDAGVDDFRAAGQTLFDIRVDGVVDREHEDDDQPGRARADGSQLRVRTPRYTMVAHDNPTAATTLRTEGTITFLFEASENLTIRADPEDAERVRFTYGEVTGSLRSDGITVNGTTVTATDRVLLILEKSRGDFDRHHKEIGQAIARGQVGAEATFNHGGSDDEIVEDIVSYGNVTMTKVRAERGNITLMVEGHGFEGRVLVLNVDGRVLGAAQADKLDLKMDNVTVARSSNFTDAIDPDNDGYAPEYYVVHDPLADPNAFQLIVTVPHYSVHTLSLTTVLELVKPAVVIGVLAGILLLVPAGLVLFRRR